MISRPHVSPFAVLCAVLLLMVGSVQAMTPEEFQRRCPPGSHNPNHDSACRTNDTATWCSVKGQLCDLAPDHPHPCCDGMRCVVPDPARMTSGRSR